MKRSEQIGELVAALAKAQSEFPAVLKDSDNPYYGSKYADLAAVIAAIRPALSKNGIAMMHTLESDLERQVAMVTVGLYHGEQFFEVEAEAPATGKGKDGTSKFDVQTIGSAWTYLRRYLLQGLTALASEDDDGNSLQNDNKPIARKTPAQVTESAKQRAAQTAQSLPQEQGKFLLVEDILSCIIKGITTKETKAKKPYLTVTFNGRVSGFNYAFCYDTKLFPIINATLDKEINIRLKPKQTPDGRDVQYFSIEDVLWADGLECENGLPIVMEDTQPVMEGANA